MSSRHWEQFKTGQALRGALLQDLVKRAVIAEVPAGTRFGPWEIVSLLGSGGMANVYLAQRVDGQFEQQVALKLVCSNAAHVDRLRHERQIVATLRHPHLVGLIDGGETEAGELWFAMTLVEGVPIDQHVQQQQPDWATLLRLFDAVCAAVEYAHGRGLIHRDIKPGNILVDQQGHPRVLDFGIALSDGIDGRGDRVLTQSYASPEQLAGENITATSDVFQLGRVLQAMLETPRLRPLPRTVRADLDRLCQRATAAKREQRYPNVTLLREDLAHLLQRRPLAQDRQSTRLRWARLVERNRTAARVLMLALLTLLAVFAFRPADPVLEILDDGYGVLADDLYGTLPDTARLLQEALGNESRGERDRAEDLLRALHAADPRTPLPAIYLAYMVNGSGHQLQGRQWLAEARQRSAGLDGVYLPLLIDYVDAEIDGTPEAIISSAGALLDIRPDAWRMRRARAHLLEYRGMRGAALREIQQIEVRELGHRQRDLALADRASMGDVAGAQAMLDRLPASQDPLMHAFLNGRLAWSRQDFPAARKHFLAAAGQAHDAARIDLYGRAQLYVSVIDLLKGDDDQALARIDRTRSLLAGRNPRLEIELSLFLAELHAEAGRSKAAGEALERALVAAVDTDSTLSNAAHFATWRLRPAEPAPMPGHLEEAEVSLWHAAAAHAASDTESARGALQEALRRGVDDTRLADEARWLALQLALPVPPQSLLDPPHPPLSRVVLRRQIRHDLAAQGLGLDPQYP